MARSVSLLKRPHCAIQSVARQRLGLASGICKDLRISAKSCVQKRRETKDPRL